MISVQLKNLNLEIWEIYSYPKVFLFLRIVKPLKIRRFSNKILILFSFPIAEISKGSRFEKNE